LYQGAVSRERSQTAFAMTPVTMKCVLVLCLAVLSHSVEPEPDTYTTTFEGEPAPAPASGATAPVTSSTAQQLGSTSTEQDSVVDTSTSMAAGTTQAPMVHKMAVTVSLNNISEIISEAALMAKLTTAMTKAAGSGATVKVVIQFINIQSLFGGFSSINHDDIITAYAAMAGLNVSQISVNNQTHSSVAGGRRLLSDATVIANVPNTEGVDCVAESQRIIAANSASALTAQLKTVNSNAYANLSCTLPNPPIAAFSVTTEVTGTSSAPTAADVETEVGTAVGGTVTATVISSSPASSTSAAAATSTSTPGNIVGQDDHAPIAPMMTLWAVVYAFMMS
jgi:hypothetical protein